MANPTPPLITDARSLNLSLETGQVGSLLGREVSSHADSDTAAKTNKISRETPSSSTNSSPKPSERRPSEEDQEQVLIKNAME